MNYIKQNWAIGELLHGSLESRKSPIGDWSTKGSTKKKFTLLSDVAQHSAFFVFAAFSVLEMTV